MSCRDCVVSELQFEILLKGENNIAMLDMIVEHFNRRNLTITKKEQIVMIQESGVKEFLDFSRDYMEPELIYFRLDEMPWEHLAEIETVLEMQWIDDVIHRNAVVSYSQPIVNSRNEIYAYEVLSRFTREDGSLIFPNEIFAAAKTRGRLYALDRLCRMAAVKYAAVLKKKTFINFIPTSIYSPEYCLQSTVKLANLLEIDPNQFVFEVVESEQVDDINHLKSILDYYNKKGFQYALDDVGEGYNTLEMLGDIKPHYMKLDMKYVQGVNTDFEKQNTARQFLKKALEIGATPLAEGIETQEDFEWLKQIGYKLFQGYLFGKPSIEPQRTIA
ncbi:EAL domain-containing protein [Solibacillus silvestris]